MNNINKLIDMISALGGSARFSDICNEYQRTNKIVLSQNHKSIIIKTLNENPDKVFYNPSNDEWNIKVEKAENERYKKSDGQEYPLVENMGDILLNIETIDAYLLGKDADEKEYAKNLIKKGVCLVGMIKNNKFKFYPSRFIGYKENTITKHKSNTMKDGKITNPRIELILNKKLEANEFYDEKFISYCQELGIVPDNKNRKYWIVD